MKWIRIAKNQPKSWKISTKINQNHKNILLFFRKYLLKKYIFDRKKSKKKHFGWVFLDGFFWVGISAANPVFYTYWKGSFKSLLIRSSHHLFNSLTGYPANETGYMAGYRISKKAGKTLLSSVRYCTRLHWTSKTRPCFDWSPWSKSYCCSGSFCSRTLFSTRTEGTPTPSASSSPPQG